MTPSQCSYLVDTPALAAYCSAIGLDRHSVTAPPLFPVIAAAKAIRPEVQAIMQQWPAVGVVQIGHRQTFHGAVNDGDVLESVATAHLQGRVTPLGTRAAVEVAVAHLDGRLVAEAELRLLLIADIPAKGEDPSPSAASSPKGSAGDTETFVITREQVAQYAQVSGDSNPIHCDDAAAQRVGLRSIVAHGLCVLGRVLAAAPASESLGGVDVRFSHPVLPGEPVTTEYTTGTNGVIRFRAATSSGPVLKRGRLWVGVSDDR